MTLPLIAIFGALTLLAAFLSDRIRGLFLFTLSILAVYALQPALPIRYLDFWLPTAALGLATVFWISLRGADWQSALQRDNLLSAAWMGLLILTLALTRFLPSLNSLLTPSTPPRLELVFAALLVVTTLAALTGRVRFGWVHAVGLVALIVLLAVLKSPEASLWMAKMLRLANGQSAETASSFDIRWLGISYITFRFIHTLRERQMGTLPEVSLREYVTYIFFYPALTAGPIDRLERFVKDLRTSFKPTQDDWTVVVQRIGLGLFKKFVLADSLALMALNAQNADKVQSTGWAWILLYAYALQIFLDFSGYTDIAIGMARMVGIRLPENFNSPYLRANITQFWNNWHMTLTQWFRAYFFNPLTRSLRTRKFPIWSVIFITQLATMILIGLWHGVTVNFVIWGIWQGLGLFIHNRWSDATRARVGEWASTTLRQNMLNVLGILLTFHFVALSWVWFVLPAPALAVQFFARLIGM
ncbi:MAG: MBOAT family protein [Anaerolineaceae bacterium]|nr:MAG: MBOAT family protein [Anaerolineaceae bacterium]